MSHPKRPILPLALSAAFAVASLTAFAAEPPTAALAGGDRDCSDFPNQKRAQRFFEAHNPSADPHHLDADGNGVACESNPCPCAGGGGGGGGDGGEARRDRAKLLKVIDGDTIRVRIHSRTRDVRLVGIDTPEVYGGEECGGPQASRSAKRMLPEGTRVRLISDPSQDNRDHYGRLLRYVERRGRDINRAQVAKGLARVYVYGGNPFKRVRRYRRSQAEAKQHDRGAWGHCDGRFRRAPGSEAGP